MKEEPQFPVISGIDTAKGIAMTGGTASGYRRVLSMFCKDVRERLQRLRLFLFESETGGNKFPEKYIPSFITQVHALKSACATIGAAEISAQAARFESSSRAGDMAYIQENLSGFIERLTVLVNNIRAALELLPVEFAVSSGGPGEVADPSRYLSLFNKLTEALKSEIVADIDHSLDELIEKAADSKTNEILESISDQILMTEFDGARKTIDKLIGSIK